MSNTTAPVVEAGQQYVNDRGTVLTVTRVDRSADGTPVRVIMRNESDGYVGMEGDFAERVANGSLTLIEAVKVATDTTAESVAVLTAISAESARRESEAAKAAKPRQGTPIKVTRGRYAGTHQRVEQVNSRTGSIAFRLSGRLFWIGQGGFEVVTSEAAYQHGNALPSTHAASAAHLETAASAAAKAEPVFAVTMTQAVILLRAYHADGADRAEISGPAEHRAARVLHLLGMVTRPHHVVVELSDRGRTWVRAFETVTHTEGAAYAAAVRVDYSTKTTEQTNAVLDDVDACRAALVAAIRRLFRITKANAKAAAVEYADQGHGLLRAVGAALGRY